MSRQVPALQNALAKMEVADQTPRLFPQIPDEITLNVLENASAMSLLTLRQVSRGLRSTVDAHSSRLCQLLQEHERVRFEATNRPLDLEGISMEEALRRRIKRWGKPPQGKYWSACRSLTRSYNAANVGAARPMFQDNVFEFLLHLHDSIHEKGSNVVESDSERVPSRCCWLEYRVRIYKTGKHTMQCAARLLDELRGLRDAMAPPIGPGELLDMIASVRLHPLEHDQIFPAEKMRLHKQFRDVVLRPADLFSPCAGYLPTLLVLPSELLWGPMCWLPKVDRSSDGRNTAKAPKAVMIAKWFSRRASTRRCCCVASGHVRILRLALLEELDVFPVEDRQHIVLDGFIRVSLPR